MITEKYKEQLLILHQKEVFGKRSKIPKHLGMFIEKIKPKTILDFGCGKGNLVTRLREDYPDIIVEGYDPGNPKYDNSIDDKKFDLIISTDVLEHIEPNFIDETLKYLSDRSNYVFHLIACSPAKHRLSDGRNAHLIIKEDQWWREKFLSLDYNILNEEYLQFFKKGKFVKKYYILAEKNHGNT